MYRKLFDRLILNGACIDVLVALQLESTKYWSVDELVVKTSRSKYWVRRAISWLSDANCLYEDDDQYKINPHGQDFLLDYNMRFFTA